MKQLQTTIAKLKRDPLHAITVVDLEVNKKVVIDATGSYLAEHYGSAEGFFEYLNKKEVHRFEVQDRRKNGSSYKKEGNYTVEADQPETAKPEIMKESNKHSQQMPGSDYGGQLAGYGALSAPEMNYKAYDHSRIVAELAMYKDKCERLEKENRKFELDNIEMRFDTSKKQPLVTSETLNSALPTLLQLLPGLLGRGGGNVPNTALGVPAENVSDLKHQFLESVMETEDEMIEYLFQVSKGISTNPEFEKELAGIMQKYQLLE